MGHCICYRSIILKYLRYGGVKMKIESSTIAMTATTTQTKTQMSYEHLKAWGDGKGLPTNENVSLAESDKQALLANMEAYQLNQQTNQNFSLSAVNSTEDEFLLEISEEDKNKIRLLNKLVEFLTGKKLRFYSPTAFLRKKAQLQPTYEMPRLIEVQPQRQGWGIDYQKHQIYTENATMDFNAQGVVKTADGKTIEIDLSLSVQRSFTSESHVSFKAGDALIDPLVINYEGASASLTNRKYKFDIDNDGKEDNISFVKNGSGFLAYDKNGDGIINNGSELFGPNTGNGFLELAAFDSDGNNWIDENDPIYEKLQIWTKNEDGEDQLFAIGQKGVGAIYLGAIQTPFEVKDSANSLQGKIQQTGIFLRENGSAGTIQHVDLSV